MNKVQMKEDRICDDMSIVYFVESKNDKVRVLGNLEGFEMINRVYDGGGIAPTIGSSHGSSYKLILVRGQDNEQINHVGTNGQQ